MLELKDIRMILGMLSILDVHRVTKIPRKTLYNILQSEGEKHSYKTLKKLSDYFIALKNEKVKSEKK